MKRSRVTAGSLAAVLAGIAGWMAVALPARGGDVPSTDRVIPTAEKGPVSVFATDVDTDAGFVASGGAGDVQGVYAPESAPAGTTTTVFLGSPFGGPGGCLIANGDFETGDLSGWTLIDVGLGSWVINDGTNNPPGPDGPLAPCSGSFSAMTQQSGLGVHTLYQDVTISATAVSASLNWTAMIRNHAGVFSDPNQEFRVEIWNPGDNSVLATLYSTDPGDRPLTGCGAFSADISGFLGQTIRVAFTEQDNLNYFNVHLDDVCINIVKLPPCGDGVIGDGEECDDGNTDDDDGCSSACTVEEGFVCTGEPSVCDPDCNANGVPDQNDPDCQPNGTPDECDIASGASSDCNVNGTPDECESPDCPANLDGISINGGGTQSESPGGTYQLTASTAQSGGVGIVTSENYQLADGFWHVVRAPALPPTVTPVGPRYLAVTPAAGESAIALLVTSPDEPCVSLYVQAPETINGHVIGRLGASAVLLTPAEWGAVNVNDEAILPGTSYTVQSELAGSTLSEPTTATTWLWADANNSGGTVDFDDILCILEGFADNYAGLCSFFGADIEGGVTNVTIDFDDVLAALNAFSGDGYFDNPTHVDPCP